MDHESCHHLLGKLSAYVDGSLEKELCAEIERHLADCADCQVVVDTLHKTIYLYHATANEVTVPEGVRQRLFKRLDLDEFLEK